LHGLLLFGLGLLVPWVTGDWWTLAGWRQELLQMTLKEARKR